MKKNRRKLIRSLLKFLPDKPRLAFVRKFVKIDSAWPSPSLEIKIATTEEELASAYRLLHDSYVRSGFMDPSPTGMRVLPQHLLPQTTTVVAKWDGRVIGTLSLIRDNPFGLPMEKIFNLTERRGTGRRLAEVSSLAMDPLFRGQINLAFFPLLRFVYQYARHYFGTHEFVIAVNPSTVDMYLGLMLFEKLSAKRKSYEFVKGAPAVGLFLNFETCDVRWGKAFTGHPDSQNFYKYWNQVPTDERNRLPQRQFHTASDLVITPHLLQKFFLERAQMAQKLTFQDLHVLLNAYPFPEFQDILLPLQAAYLRKAARIETQMRAEFGPEKILTEVWNVSKEGLLIKTLAGSLNLKQKAEISIWLNETTCTSLQVEVCWSAETYLYGLRILSGTKEWDTMIQLIESDYVKASARIFRVA